MKKRMFLDLETTGTDPNLHTLIQVGFIIEIGGKVKEEFVGCGRPNDLELARIQKKAIEAHGMTPDMIRGYQPLEQLYKQILGILPKYFTDQYGSEPFDIWGQNARFDTNFWINFFLKYGCKWDTFIKLFNPNSVDLISVTSLLQRVNLIPPGNLKLDTLCDLFGIVREKSHDALEDIRATKKIFDIISAVFIKDFSEVDGALFPLESKLFIHFNS